MHTSFYGDRHWVAAHGESLCLNRGTTPGPIAHTEPPLARKGNNLPSEAMIYFVDIEVNGVFCNRFSFVLFNRSDIWHSDN